MDGMNYFRDEAGSTFEQTTTRPASVRQAFVVTALVAVITLGLLIGLRSAGYPPPIADEIAMTSGDW